MAIINRYSFLILCFCVLVDSRFFHRPLILDDEFIAMLESNTPNARRPVALSNNQTLSSDNVDNNIRQLNNNYENGRTFKLKFHSNLNLPRYLRHTGPNFSRKRI